MRPVSPYLAAYAIDGPRNKQETYGSSNKSRAGICNVGCNFSHGRVISSLCDGGEIQCGRFQNVLYKFIMRYIMLYKQCIL